MPASGFLNVAHRGARAFAPENTLPAIRVAARLGANAVELDVQMSRDGELVLVLSPAVAQTPGQAQLHSRADYSASRLQLTVARCAH